MTKSLKGNRGESQHQYPQNQKIISIYSQFFHKNKIIASGIFFYSRMRCSKKKKKEEKDLWRGLGGLSLVGDGGRRATCGGNLTIARHLDESRGN